MTEEDDDRDPEEPEWIVEDVTDDGRAVLRIGEMTWILKIPIEQVPLYRKWVIQKKER